MSDSAATTPRYSPGSFWIGADGEVWRLIAYSESPTMTLERVKDGERKSGVVNARIFDGFDRLRPESKA